MGFVNDNRNTVDHERKIVLIFHSGSMSGLQNLGLDLHEQLIRFEARVKNSVLVAKPTVSTPAKFDYYWEVDAVEVPEGFPEDRNTICNVIIEALTAFGEYGLTARINKVSVEFRNNAYERAVTWSNA